MTVAKNTLQSKSPGKPETLSATKRRDILRGANEIFLAQGYLGANMDEIATLASVSKATIYKHFGNKKTLFEEIIRGRVEGLMAPLHVEGRAESSLSDVLMAFAHQYIDLILQPSSLALYRVVVFEASHNDELGLDSYRVGGAVAVSQIADFFASQARLGRLVIEDSSVAAEQFIGSLTGHLQLRALLGVEIDPPPELRNRYAAAAVSTFLRAYEVKPN